MQFDAFTGGVEPGGLRSQNDIRLLICYLLSSVKEPLAKNDIVLVLQDAGLANYFEASSALSDVLAKGNADTLEDNPDLCVANDNTREISAQLVTTLPPSVRDHAVEGALNLLAMARRERENKVEIEKQQDGGYQVTCHISGGDRDLMCIDLYVPDQYQARAVKKHFHRNPEKIYQVLLCLMTGNQEYLETLLKEF